MSTAASSSSSRPQAAWRAAALVAGVGAVAAAAGWSAWSLLRRRQQKHTAAAAVKPELYDMPAYTQLTLADAQLVFDSFRPVTGAAAERRFTVVRIKELTGGLSNSNYLFVVRDALQGGRETSLLLKVCEEKNFTEVAHQLGALALIRRLTLDETVEQHAAFPRPCPIAYAYRCRVPAEEDVTLENSIAQLGEGTAEEDAAQYIFHAPSISTRPLVFYQFLDGIMVDSPSSAIMHEVARAQAQLHAVPLAHPSGDFAFLPSTPFGMFAIRAQYEAQVLGDAIQPSPWLAHPFVIFLQKHLPALDECAEAAPALPQGIIHSDLFFQNMIFTRESAPSSDGTPAAKPQILGMIDFEEMGRGPRVLDVAMTIVGCCYPPATNRLDVGLMRAFLTSYEQFTPLTSEERRLFPSFLMWAILAIAYWRWQNFNVVHTEPNERKNAYLAMQQRVEDLAQPSLQQAFASLFA